MTPARYNPWLFRFAVLTALATFLLLGLGGLVTSHEAGMSVPDWPNTYGYNMFLFPPAQWVGGIFYEHTHRLLASAVGLMTTILAVWLWLKDGRSWMHWLGVAAFLGVVAQGVLGGLRVTLHLDSLGIFHGTIAQVFFVLTCVLALFTSRWWANLVADKSLSPVPGGLQTLVLAATLLVLGQLILGATMRHQHAGLAIPDFPLAYGRVWPDTGADAVAQYNAQRTPMNGINPVTAFQIELQMAHRLMALAILVLVALCAGQARRRLGGRDALARLAAIWLGLVLAQGTLGAATIWTNKAADVATLHVLAGSLALALGALWFLIARHRAQPLTETQADGTFGAQAAFAANQ
ncbi:MAG TPA: COX15/CtaA family protein [Candidatus Acidoferrum sp.]|nr:COX15/CtaA family protein [Candidatus Acidoferrum sp.]